MEFTNIQDMIQAYKSFGAAKESFHMNGQQVVEFQDDAHASGSCYVLAHLVHEKDGEDILTVHGIRYFDQYVKTEEGWKIGKRDQYFVFTDSRPLPGMA